MEAKFYLTKQQWETVYSLLLYMENKGEDGAIIAQPPNHIDDPVRLLTVNYEQAKAILAIIRPGKSLTGKDGS